MSVTDPVAQFDTRFNWYAGLGAGIWLIFLAPAAQSAWGIRDTPAGWAALLLLPAFCALYVWSFIWARPYRHDGSLWRSVNVRAVGVVALLFGLGLNEEVTNRGSTVRCGVGRGSRWRASRRTRVIYSG